MTELQQSPLYAEYMKRLKWKVTTVDGTYIFLKRLLFTGTLAKIHRPSRLPPARALTPILEREHVRRLIIEPASNVPQDVFTHWLHDLPKNIAINRTPFLPTKTIHVDLTPPIAKIFQSFSEAKRRAVRRATNLGIVVKTSQDIGALIRVKNKSAGFLGFITTTGIRELWDVFNQKHAEILLAYTNTSKQPIGGVLMLYCDNVAYYWIAGATKVGKKYFSPTLLAWEAMKLAKKHGAYKFDFVGAWDERAPKNNLEWKGFTKFKEGFGGHVIYYPLSKNL